MNGLLVQFHWKRGADKRYSRLCPAEIGRVVLETMKASSVMAGWWPNFFSKLGLYFLGELILYTVIIFVVCSLIYGMGEIIDLLQDVKNGIEKLNRKMGENDDKMNI